MHNVKLLSGFTSDRLKQMLANARPGGRDENPQACALLERELLMRMNYAQIMMSDDLEA